MSNSCRFFIIRWLYWFNSIIIPSCKYAIINIHISIKLFQLSDSVGTNNNFIISVLPNAGIKPFSLEYIYNTPRVWVFLQPARIFPVHCIVRGKYLYLINSTHKMFVSKICKTMYKNGHKHPLIIHSGLRIYLRINNKLKERFCCFQVIESSYDFKKVRKCLIKIVFDFY